MREQETRNK
jgi:hypothetical protein